MPSPSEIVRSEESDDLEEDLRIVNQFEETRKAYVASQGRVLTSVSCRYKDDLDHMESRASKRFPAVVRELVEARREIERLRAELADKGEL